MSARLARLLALAALFAAGCAGLPDRPPSDPDAAVLERQILLTIHQPRTAAVGLTGETTQRYLRRRDYGPTPAVERTLAQIAREHGLKRVDGWPISSLDAYCEVFEVPLGVSVEEVVRRLARDPRIEIVQRMNAFRTLATGYDDPYAELQSSVVLLDLERAHQLATGRGVTVAVVDSAVDMRHPELRGRVRVARDLVGERALRRHAEIHGTAVAGVIASAANNSEGIVGVAPDADIAALRACWASAPDGPSAVCSSFSLARALEAVIALAPEIVNLSLAGPEDPLLGRMLDEIVRRGIVVVTAEPDGTAPDRSFPASHPGVIVAGAAAATRGVSDLQRVPAPASEILTTMPNGGYAFLSGTSLAAAHVSGVAALLLQHDRSLTAAGIAALLVDSTAAGVDGLASISAREALERLSGTRTVTARRSVRF